MLQDFKKFLFQGDIIDLAVAVIVGLAFKAVIDSLVNDIISPLIGMIIGKPSFNDLTLTINNGVIRYGAFLTALINFVIIAAALFIVVRTYEALQARRRSGDEPAPEPTEEVALLTEIRDALTKA